MPRTRLMLPLTVAAAGVVTLWTGIHLAQRSAPIEVAGTAGGEETADDPILADPPSRPQERYDEVSGFDLAVLPPSGSSQARRRLAEPKGIGTPGRREDHSLDVPRPFSQEEMTAWMREHYSTLTPCYETFLKAHGDQGPIRAVVHLATEGHAGHTYLKGHTTFDDIEPTPAFEDLGLCLAEQLSRPVFLGEVDGASLEYPLMFDAQQ